MISLDLASTIVTLSAVGAIYRIFVAIPRRLRLSIKVDIDGRRDRRSH